MIMSYEEFKKRVEAARAQAKANEAAQEETKKKAQSLLGHLPTRIRRDDPDSTSTLSILALRTGELA